MNTSVSRFNSVLPRKLTGLIKRDDNPTGFFVIFLQMGNKKHFDFFYKSRCNEASQIVNFTAFSLGFKIADLFFAKTAI